MAQLITVRLNRADVHQPWGLRLQGGKDFGTPLVVQKVNMGSIADQAGLIAGDSLIKVNNLDVFNLRHKDAQDVIVRSGNAFEVTVQRGGSTWRPTVTPTSGMVPSPTPGYTSTHVNTVTKTSLAHKQQDVQHIGSGYNNAARPFNAHNGFEPSVKSIVNKQYNTPVGIYSEESIAETLSAQAEVLAGGVLGVNFKKNEKVYNSAGSEVLKALQESENEPAEPASKNYFWTASHTVGSAAESRTQTPSCFAKVQEDNAINKSMSVSATETINTTTEQQHNLKDQKTTPANATTPPCDDCGASIVGVFVRIKDKNLHVECFRCATCGTSLKNQGYFNLNNKLYCDIHAKLAALQHPPPGTEGFKPVPIQPNTKLSATTISAALDAHHNGTSNLNSNLAGPKPFAYGSGPAPAGPKSPSLYQPPRPQTNWNKPAPTVQQHYQPPYAGPIQNYSTPPQNYVSNTLPRSAGQNIPGRFTAQKPGYRYSQGPNKGLTFGATSAPRRGRGILNKAVGAGGRIPQCGCCNAQIRGPFITALGRIWCPDHFVCVTSNCRRPLQDIGFVEEKGELYCEFCFEKYLAPPCDRCAAKIKGDCLNAIGKHFHPECFKCTYCGKLFGNSPFFLEDGQPYCEADWNEMFTTKCFACGFPIESGDRWVEALSHNYHSQCFNCTTCKKNLEGQSFFAKGGRPFCKNHVR